MPRTKITMSLALDPETQQRLIKLSHAQGISRSQLANRLLAESLVQEELAFRAFSSPTIVQAFGKVFSQPGMLRQMVEAMGEELSDDQLELFRQTFENLAAAEEKAASGQAAKPRRKEK